MFDRARSLLTRVGPYGMAAATQAGTSFVVLPLLLLLIGAESYGRYALLEPLVAMLAQLLLLGAHQGLLHAVCKENVAPLHALKRTVAFGQAYMLPLALLAAGLVGWWQGQAQVGILFGVALYLESVNLACFTTVRAIGDAWSFFAATVLRSMTMLVGIVIATASAGRNRLDERFALALIASGTVLSVLLLSSRIARQHRRQGTPADTTTESPLVMMTKSVKYGFPLVLAGLCQSTIALADRFILNAFVSPAALTAYVVAVKLANALNLAATPVNLWWPTARFQHLKDRDGGAAFFRGAAVKIGGVYGAVALMLIAVTPWLLPVLGPGVQADPGIAALLVLAAFFQAFQVVLNVGMLTAGHTAKSFYIAAAAAVFHAAGCFALVGPFGAHGVAAMGVITGALFCLAVNHMSQRVLKVPVNMKAIGFELACVATAALSMAAWGWAK